MLRLRDCGREEARECRDVVRAQAAQQCGRALCQAAKNRGIAAACHARIWCDAQRASSAQGAHHDTPRCNAMPPSEWLAESRVQGFLVSGGPEQHVPSPYSASWAGNMNVSG